MPQTIARTLCRTHCCSRGGGLHCIKIVPSRRPRGTVQGRNSPMFRSYSRPRRRFHTIPTLLTFATEAPHRSRARGRPPPTRPRCRARRRSPRLPAAPASGTARRSRRSARPCRCGGGTASARPSITVRPMIGIGALSRRSVCAPCRPESERRRPTAARRGDTMLADVARATSSSSGMAKSRISRGGIAPPQGLVRPARSSSRTPRPRRARSCAAVAPVGPSRR